MSHPDHRAFSTEIPINDPEAMTKFQETMDQHAEATNKHIDALGVELGISNQDAGSVYLLRTRSRWTQSLENRLVAAFKAGHGDKIFVNGEEEEKLVELGF